MKSLYFYALLPAIHLVCAVPAISNEGQICYPNEGFATGVCTSAATAPPGYVLISNMLGKVQPQKGINFVKCSDDGSSKCQIQAPMCDKGGERRSYCLNPGQLCGFGLSYTLSADHKVQPYCVQGQNCEQSPHAENGYFFSYKLVDSTLCPENLGCCRVYATPTQGQGELPSSELHTDATPTYDETQQKEYIVGESDTDSNYDQLFDS